MARGREIERKFLVDKTPPRLRRHPSVSILQGYFPLTGHRAEIRLRKIDRQHVITIKSGPGVGRIEEEIPISREAFRVLWPLAVGGHITKRRYRVPWRGLTVEVDVFGGPHRGLTTADVEFDSIAESRRFQPPAWLGREITGNRRFANIELARRRSVPRLPARRRS